MKTNNNFPADNEVTKTDTPNVLFSDSNLLKFFNLERENVQDFSITRRKGGMYVNITLNKEWVQCPVCRHMTNRVKDYTDKKIIHSVLSITNCYIVYHARRYQCPHCKKTVMYVRLPDLLTELDLAKVQGNSGKRINQYIKCDCLILEKYYGVARPLHTVK